MISTAEMRKIAEQATTQRVNLDEDVQGIERHIEQLQLQLASLEAAKAEVLFDLNLAAEYEHHAWAAVSEAEGVDHNNMYHGVDY